jgi:alcohol dehydrogenase YqhD (iron-dependent ADH family)
VAQQQFLFALPTRVTFGPGAVESIAGESSKLGTKALLVTGSTFARRSGLIERVRSALRKGGAGTEIYAIERSPTVADIDRGGVVAREAGVDFIVGLGGGAALDAAKAVAVAAVSAHSIWDYTSHSNGTPKLPIEHALPIIQVPIVASTGTETNDVAVILDTDRRMRAPIRSPHLQARAAIVDPTLTVTVPPHYTAVGGINIVSQMVESYLTSDEFPVTDRIAEGLMTVVMDSLPRAMRRGEDLEARTNLSYVAALAPTLAQAGREGVLPVRAMAHPLSARFNLEHGAAVSALWPSFMRYALGNRTRLPQIGRFKRYALLGRRVFSVHETDDEVAAEVTLYRFANWLRNMNMPTDLLGLDVELDALPELAQQAVEVSGREGRLSGGLTTEDVENIYQGALRPL